MCKFRYNLSNDHHNLYLTPTLNLSRMPQNRTTVKNKKRNFRIGILVAVYLPAEEKYQTFTVITIQLETKKAALLSSCSRTKTQNTDCTPAGVCDAAQGVCF